MSIPAPSPASLAFTPAMPSPPAFDRYAWEHRILTSELHRDARLVALVLAHHADASGYMPSGGVQSARRLAQLCRLTPNHARRALQQLSAGHHLARPANPDSSPSAPTRPVLLTMPPHPVPEHPGPGESA